MHSVPLAHSPSCFGERCSDIHCRDFCPFLKYNGTISRLSNGAQKTKHTYKIHTKNLSIAMPLSGIYDLVVQDSP